MRVIYAGLSCFLLASVVACGGQSADDASSDAGVGGGGDAASDEGSNKPDDGKDDTKDGGGDRDEAESDTDPTAILDAASPGTTGTVTGTGTATTAPTNSGAGGATGVTDDTSAGATGNVLDDDPTGAGATANVPDDDTTSAGGDSGSGTTDTDDTAPTDTDVTDSDTETDDTDTSTDDTETDDTDTSTDDTDTGAGGTGPGPTTMPTMTTPPVIVIIPPKFNEVVIPDGCEQEGDHTGESSCGASFSCDGTYFDSNCTDLGDTASCYCYGNGFDYSYVLSGLDDDELCTYPLELCRSGKLKESGPETCSATTPQLYKNDCYASKPCTQALDLGNGVTATKTVSSANLSCYRNDTTWGCTCSDESRYENYELTGATQETSCPSLVPVCLDDVTPTYGETECEDYPDGDSEYCNLNRSCTQEADLGTGVSLTKTSNTQASCYNYEDYTQCDCYSPYYFTYTTEAVADDQCDAAMDVCNANLDDVNWGANNDDCEVTRTQIDGGNCYGDVRCSWDVTLGGVPVSVSGNGSMYCYAQDDDEETWNCTCSSSGKTFEVAIGDVPISTCSEALLNCASDTVPGNQGGIIVGGGGSAPPSVSMSSPD